MCLHAVDSSMRLSIQLPVQPPSSSVCSCMLFTAPSFVSFCESDAKENANKVKEVGRINGSNTNSITAVQASSNNGSLKVIGEQTNGTEHDGALHVWTDGKWIKQVNKVWEGNVVSAGNSGMREFDSISFDQLCFCFITIIFTQALLLTQEL